jgi:hypothetical protein
MTFAESIAAARARNFHGPDPAQFGDPFGGDFLDFDDPVDRHAAFLRQVSIIGPEVALSKVTTVAGQVQLAEAWRVCGPSERQLYRRRAALALEFAIEGRELRSRPEENAA